MRHAIFITFDDGYAKYAIRCIKSLVKNYPDYPTILTFYNGKDITTLNFLESVQNLVILNYTIDFLKTENLSLEIKNSPIVCFRYILWTERFDDYDTILYLDVDCLVLKPLDFLFLYEDFFAIADYTPFGYSAFKKEYYGDNVLINKLKQDQFSLQPSQYKMMNSGVFVIPKKYRKRNHFQKLIELTEKYSKYCMCEDQGIISLWCHHNKIGFSDDIRLNFQLCFLYNDFLFYNYFPKISDLLSDIHIMHYTWWKPDSSFYNKFLEITNVFQNFDNEYRSLLKDT